MFEAVMGVWRVTSLLQTMETPSGLYYIQPSDIQGTR